MLVSTTLYTLVGIKLRMMRSIGNNATNERILAKRIQTMKMLLVLMIAYYTLTLPIFIKKTVDVISSGTRDVCVKVKGAFGVKTICMLMALLSTIVNPIILAYFNGTVKHQWRKTFSMKKIERQPSSRSEVTS